MSTKRLELDALKKLGAELRAAWDARTLPAGVISTDSIVGLSRVIAALEADIAKPVEPVAIPLDFMTHKMAWLTALTIARDEAEVSAPDIDDRAYWEHEISAFQRAYADLEISTPQEPAAAVWMPIETAPKDGGALLLYSPSLKNFSVGYRNICIAWWVVGRTNADDYWGTEVFFDGRSIVQHVHNATHWMQLPAAPGGAA